MSTSKASKVRSPSESLGFPGPAPIGRARPAEPNEYKSADEDPPVASKNIQKALLVPVEHDDSEVFLKHNDKPTPKRRAPRTHFASPPDEPVPNVDPLFQSGFVPTLAHQELNSPTPELVIPPKKDLGIKKAEIGRKDPAKATGEVKHKFDKAELKPAPKEPKNKRQDDEKTEIKSVTDKDQVQSPFGPSRVPIVLGAVVAVAAVMVGLWVFFQRRSTHEPLFQWAPPSLPF